MKDMIINALILFFLVLVLLKLNCLEADLNDANEAIMGSTEAVITEIYRYRAD